MKDMIREVIQFRHLLYMLAWKDIKIRYKQTVMGFLWAILMPTLIVLAGLIVRKAMSFLSGKPMETSELLSVMVKSLPWAFFIGTIRIATNSLVGNRSLVTKIYFPREVFPFSAVLANLFDFAISCIALVVAFVLWRVEVSVHALWFLPLMVMLVIMTAGFGMILSFANLFFRDVKYIVEVIVTFAIFFTPVFYDAKSFGKWETLLLLNPVGAILESMSLAIVHHRTPDPFWLSYAALWAFGGCLASWYVFHRSEHLFAEYI
jgi:lipopolysaccharide transport system permease protein